MLFTTFATLCLAGLSLGAPTLSDRRSSMPAPNVSMPNATTASASQACQARVDGKLPAYTSQKGFQKDFHFSGNVRTYYLTAEKEEWDYAPTGWDNWEGVPLNESVHAKSGSIGFKYLKARYNAYEDANLTKKVEQPSWVGVQGPVLRAEVGDLVEVLFVNRLPDHYASVHSMGLGYGKSTEGSDYEPTFNSGDAVPPGGCYTYKWVVGNSSAPTGDLDSASWGYHSFVNLPADAPSGLFGPFIVYKQGKMDSVMSSNREFVLHYDSINETASFLAGENVRKYLGEQAYANLSSAKLPAKPMGANSSVAVPQWVNSLNVTLDSSMTGSFNSINGRVLLNLPGLDMCDGDSVIWYLYSLGTKSHAVHFHGNNVMTTTGQTVVTHSLQPGNHATVKMNAHGVGSWQVVCHVNHHISTGMVALYNIHDANNCPLKPLQS